MADISVQEKQGSSVGWIWPAAAIIAIIALMAWLFTTQDTTTEVVTAADGDTAQAEAPAAAEAADLGAVSTNPAEYEGREIALSGISVDSELGDRAFWTQAGGSLFLVVAGPEVTDISWLAMGRVVSGEGTVRPLDESALNRLLNSGALHPDAREQTTFATHFFEMTSVSEEAAGAEAGDTGAVAQ